MHKYLLSLLIASIAITVAPAANSKTIADFESSTFYKKETLISKNPAYDLQTGGRNNSYSFKDTENTYSNIGVDLTTKGQDIVKIGVHWNGQSTLHPAKMSAKKIEQINNLAAFWGIPNQAKAIIDYAKLQQLKNYSDGSDQAPRKSIGSINIHCGTTGETLWVGWETISQNASVKARK